MKISGSTTRFCGLLLFALGLLIQGSLAQNSTHCGEPGFECSFDCQQSAGNNSVILSCGAGFLCRADELPRRCPEGYYCPNATEQVSCPEGSWCPKGSWKPIDCPPMASSTSKGHRYIFWGFFIYTFFIVAYLFGVNFLFQKRNALFRRILDFLGKGELFYTFKEDEEVIPTAEFTKHSRQEPMEFKFENLEVRVRNTNWLTNRLCPTEEKVILKGASGEFKSGRLSAIMGPSGAGKTTLMNVLLGKVTKTAGLVYVNGEEDRVEKYSKNIGFVPQDDIMIPNLTVRTIIEHSARTRLPATWTEGQKQELVQETIKVMGLAHIQDSVIGHVSHRIISGGERKRVNIAIELVNDPSALFLDEPTSGLDSSSAKAVMLYLKEIAKKLGITVVAILHQPRSDLFELVDDIILLGEGGRTVYSGPRSKTLQYFSSIGFPCPEHANQADFYLDVISGHIHNRKKDNFTQDDLFDSWDEYISEHGTIESDSDEEEDSIEVSSTDEEGENKAQKESKTSNASKKQRALGKPTIRQTPGFLYQLLIFFQRAVIQQLSSFHTRLSDTFLHCLAGLVIGVAFFSQPTFVPPIPEEYREYCPKTVAETFCHFAEVDNSYRIGVYLSMGVGLITVSIAVRTFYNERLVYWREASAGTNTIAYFIAKNVVDIEGMLFNSWMLTTAFYVVTAPRGSFSGYFIGIFLYEFCVSAIAYIFSWLLPNPELFSVIIALILGLGTGSTKEVKKMSIAGYLTPSRWLGEAQYVLEINEDEFLHPSQVANVEDFLDWRFNFDIDNFGVDLVALFILGLGFRFLGYLCMRYVNRDKQR